MELEEIYNNYITKTKITNIHLSSLGDKSPPHQPPPTHTHKTQLKVNGIETTIHHCYGVQEKWHFWHLQKKPESKADGIHKKPLSGQYPHVSHRWPAYRSPTPLRQHARLQRSTFIVAGDWIMNSSQLSVLIFLRLRGQS